MLICAPQPHQVLTGESEWVKVGTVGDFPANGGAAVLYGKSQLAVYNVARRGVRKKLSRILRAHAGRRRMHDV